MPHHSRSADGRRVLSAEFKRTKVQRPPDELRPRAGPGPDHDAPAVTTLSSCR
jgi:hypothetical protein